MLVLRGRGGRERADCRQDSEEQGRLQRHQVCRQVRSSHGAVLLQHSGHQQVRVCVCTRARRGFACSACYVYDFPWDALTDAFIGSQCQTTPFAPFLLCHLLRVSASERREMEDVERNGYCFTDGVGRMSLDLARDVQRRWELPEVPSAIQIRFGGAKGVLTLYPAMRRGCRYVYESYSCRLSQKLKMLYSLRTAYDSVSWPRAHVRRP